MKLDYCTTSTYPFHLNNNGNMSYFSITIFSPFYKSKFYDPGLYKTILEYQ